MPRGENLKRMNRNRGAGQGGAGRKDALGAERVGTSKADGGRDVQGKFQPGSTAAKRAGAKGGKKGGGRRARKSDI